MSDIRHLVRRGTKLMCKECGYNEQRLKCCPDFLMKCHCVEYNTTEIEEVSISNSSYIQIENKPLNFKDISITLGDAPGNVFISGEDYVQIRDILTACDGYSLKTVLTRLKYEVKNG